MCRRGDIYNVDFGKNTESRKQYGIRPALVVSNNQANQYSPVITVVPLTSRIYKKRFLPTHGKRQILRSLPNYAPLFIGGAYCNIQLEVLSTMA